MAADRRGLYSLGSVSEYHSQFYASTCFPISSHGAEQRPVLSAVACEKSTNEMFDVHESGSGRRLPPDRQHHRRGAGRLQAAYGRVEPRTTSSTTVYGLLHSPEYRETYAADLKKMLPRIPFGRDDFRAFADAGKRLSELHVGYETVEPYPLEGLTSGRVPVARRPTRSSPSGTRRCPSASPPPSRRPQGRSDRSVIHYNERITLRGIPEEAYRYTLGSGRRSSGSSTATR